MVASVRLWGSLRRLFMKFMESWSRVGMCLCFLLLWVLLYVLYII